jgi:hypothetical protein
VAQTYLPARDNEQSACAHGSCSSVLTILLSYLSTSPTARTRSTQTVNSRTTPPPPPGRMVVLRSTQSLQAEVDELRASLLVGPGWRHSGRHADAKRTPGGEPGGAAARAVCVTGGISFVGFAVVDRLLRHGYTVRLALETQGQPPLATTTTASCLSAMLLLAGEASVVENLPVPTQQACSVSPRDRQDGFPFAGKRGKRLPLTKSSKANSCQF